LSSCRVIQGSDTYIDTNENGRQKLKTMHFRSSFRPEMAQFIDITEVYINIYENKASNYISYKYLRFFKDGQYALFENDKKDIDVNKLSKARFVGYFNVVNDNLLIEIPNVSFSRTGKNHILRFNILDNSNLEEIPDNKVRTSVVRIYKKEKNDNLFGVIPDW